MPAASMTESSVRSVPKARYSLPVAEPIRLTGLGRGRVTVYVVGKNSAGFWQPESEAASRSWSVVFGSSPLRVTELMFNPAEPSAAEADAGFGNNDDFEFIELANTGDFDADLGQVTISDGVEFSFGEGFVFRR